MCFMRQGTFAHFMNRFFGLCSISNFYIFSDYARQLPGTVIINSVKKYLRTQLKVSLNSLERVSNTESSAVVGKLLLFTEITPYFSKKKDHFLFKKSD